MMQEATKTAAICMPMVQEKENGMTAPATYHWDTYAKLNCPDVIKATEMECSLKENLQNSYMLQLVFFRLQLFKIKNLKAVERIAVKKKNKNLNSHG